MVTVPPRALVTGGGVRVGRAIALALGAAGFDVAVHYHGSGDAASSTVAQLRSSGRRTLRLRADLSDPDQIEALFQQLSSQWPHLDLLVNSAAIFPRARPEEVRIREWDRLFALNVRAPFLCARAAVQLMGERGGCVVNIADVAAFEAWPAHAGYAATKAALVSLTRSLALAWAPRIRVNAVAPGAVLLPEGTSREEAARAAARAALGRVGSAADVAEAVVYLSRAQYVTGEVLRVDGGGHLR
ncbi:MAG: SDR family NAD(P)-dependent oxidoreductase [Gemmatimonadota bacterium]